MENVITQRVAVRCIVWLDAWGVINLQLCDIIPKVVNAHLKAFADRAAMRDTLMKSGSHTVIRIMETLPRYNKGLGIVFSGGHRMELRNDAFNNFAFSSAICCRELGRLRHVSKDKGNNAQTAKRDKQCWKHNAQYRWQLSPEDEQQDACDQYQQYNEATLSNVVWTSIPRDVESNAITRGKQEHLTRHKISDRWRGGTWLRVEGGISWKVRNRACQPFAASSG
jgi:hypothetical protein